MLPVGVQRFVAGSYSSVVDSWAPPTTRTRPFPSSVAVRVPRATDMLAVAVQLPAAVLRNARSGVADRAPTWTELEPEASAGTASVRSAQLADATDLMLMTKPPLLASMTRRE